MCNPACRPEVTPNVDGTHLPYRRLAGTFLEGQVTKSQAKAHLAQTEAEAKAEIEGAPPTTQVGTHYG